MRIRYSTKNHTLSTFWSHQILINLLSEIESVKKCSKRIISLYYTHDFETQKNPSHKQSVLFYGPPVFLYLKNSV